MPDIEPALQLLGLMASAFGAATLLPLSSEVVMIAALKGGQLAPPLVLAASTIGNVGGSGFNWWLGRHARRFEGRRWFPFAPAAIGKASELFTRYGLPALLFSWLPVLGDPLTFIAGALRVPFLVFLPLVAVGKLCRYLALAAAVGAL
jgi:membrane protein YqaA with SNARE-associated domain